MNMLAMNKHDSYVQNGNGHALNWWRGCDEEERNLSGGVILAASSGVLIDFLLTPFLTHTYTDTHFFDDTNGLSCWGHRLLSNCSCGVLSRSIKSTLCKLLDCSPPGSSVHGMVQARILEQIAISFSGASSPCSDWTCASCISYFAGRFFTCWAIREAPKSSQQDIPAQAWSLKCPWSTEALLLVPFDLVTLTALFGNLQHMSFRPHSPSPSKEQCNPVPTGFDLELCITDFAAVGFWAWLRR